MNCARPHSGGCVSTVNTTVLHGPWWVDSAGEEEVQTRRADYKLQVLFKVQLYPYCLCTHCVPTPGQVSYREAVGCGASQAAPWNLAVFTGTTGHSSPHTGATHPPSPHLCSQHLLLRHPEPVQVAGSHSPQLPTPLRARPMTKPSRPSIYSFSLH